MEDKCIICGADVTDQSRWHCSTCEVNINNMNTTAQSIYKIRLNRHIRWVNAKPPKWKFISYIKWLKERPPRP